MGVVLDDEHDRLVVLEVLAVVGHPLGRRLDAHRQGLRQAWLASAGAGRTSLVGPAYTLRQVQA